MVEVTPALAERVADVARLLADDDSDATLHRLTRLGAELVPGTAGAAVTITAHGQAHTFAASDPRIDKLHRLQFAAGDGPVPEALRYNEPRHARDLAREHRWPQFCQAAAAAGFGSCLALPLHTGGQPAGAVALALLFAAQGGTAIHNVDVYGTCRELVHNLQGALESRAAIEQAKNILHAELGVSPDEAFRLLSRTSQDTNQKVRDLATRLIRGEIAPQQFRRRQPPGGPRQP
jgi:hypothetical protein